MADTPVRRVLGAPLATLLRWWGLLPVAADGSAVLDLWHLLPLLAHSVHVLGLRSLIDGVSGDPPYAVYIVGSESALSALCLLLFAASLVQCARGVFGSVVRGLARFDAAAGFGPGPRVTWTRSLSTCMLFVATVRNPVLVCIMASQEQLVHALAIFHVRNSFNLSAVLVCRTVAEIHARFAHLNRALAGAVLGDEVAPVRGTGAAVARLRRLHVLLGDVVHAHNSCFGVQLLALVTSTLVHAVAEAVFLNQLQRSTLVRQSLTPLSKIGRQLDMSIDLLCLAIVCSRAVAEASKTSEILSSVDLFKKPSSLRKEIKTFMLQLELESCSFSAAGLFPISVKSVLQILVVQFTYICVTMKN